MRYLNSIYGVVHKMTLEEIKRNAPNGSTGYRLEIALNGKIIYYKGKNYMWLDRWNEWVGGDNQNYEINPL